MGLYIKLGLHWKVLVSVDILDSLGRSLGGLRSLRSHVKMVPLYMKLGLHWQVLVSGDILDSLGRSLGSLGWSL